MTIHTIADITPGGTPTQVSTNKNLQATWISFAPAGTTIRVGDASTAAGVGVLLQNLVVTTLPPPGSFDQGPISLASIYIYGAGGDKVSITYGS